MGTKHTPGPWEVGPVDDTVVTHVGADGVRLVVAEIDGDYNQPETWPIMEANARLIAAAPELLEAAIELKDVCNRPSAARTRAEAWRKLDKAIAKALQPNAMYTAKPAI